MNFWEMIGTAVPIALGLMAGLWLVYVFTRKASIVDIGWTVTIAFLSWYYFLFSSKGLPHWILLSVVSIWAFRLTLLLIGRMASGLVDQRYEELSKKWRKEIGWKYLVFYQLQGLAAVVLSVPIAMAMASEPSLAMSILGATIFAIAITGEHFADQTMHQFRLDPQNKNKVCRNGLWAYSRHPNYFFEWLNWISFSLFAVSAPLGWIGFLSPLLMLYFVLRVTGVPPTEEQLLKTRGDAYKKYQAEVSTFVPWFPRKHK